MLHAPSLHKIKNNSCEIEHFVETHICKLCVMLRARVLHRAGFKWPHAGNTAILMSELDDTLGNARHQSFSLGRDNTHMPTNEQTGSRDRIETASYSY